MKRIENYTEQRTFLEGFGSVKIHDRGNDGWEFAFGDLQEVANGDLDRIWIKMKLKDHWRTAQLSELVRVYQKHVDTSESENEV